MSMQVGGKKGLTSDINMTPMIDVLLVLIIIFMVITPIVSKGLDTLVPQPNPNADKQKPQDNNRTIVIQVIKGGGLKINQEDVTEATLGSRLTEIFSTRAERVAFVKGDDNLEFKEVAKVIDIAKGAGVDKIGLMTAKMEQGQ
jgi:biopolymer transport protein TolR